MPTELLISNTDANFQGRGEVVAYYESPHTWGNKEGLPNYVHLTISDVSKEKVEDFLRAWDIEFSHTILNENEQGYRIKVEVDPAWISASDVGKHQMHAKMQDFVIDRYNGQIVSIDSAQMTADIPKPVDLQQLKKDFADVFNKVLNARRYYFSETDMDNAVSQGGHITLTKQQALDRVIDKLTE
jgi:hypothetical protein